MFLIVGLGNPGEKYLDTRHNIGFMAVHTIVRRYNFLEFKEKFKGLVSTGEIDGNKCAVLMPATFMNLSGESVQPAANFYKVSPENIIVIHDEIDLEELKVRIKIGGGNAGHNGLKSIQQKLGTANFKRIRIGVGHPGEKERVHAHVLGKFTKEEAPKFDELCNKIADVMPLVLSGDDKRAVSNIAIK